MPKHALRQGAVAHRYAGVVGGTMTDLMAVGVRCDDEDPAIGESFILRLRPGRVEVVAAVPFAVKNVFGTRDAPLLEDHDGHVWTDVLMTPRIADDIAAPAPITPPAHAPKNTRCMGKIGARTLYGTPTGLFAQDGDDDVTIFRPSLRAHHITPIDGGLAIVSDLFIAVTDDGIDLLIRDLAAFVRASV